MREPTRHFVHRPIPSCRHAFRHVTQHSWPIQSGASPPPLLPELVSDLLRKAPWKATREFHKMEAMSQGRMFAWFVSRATPDPIHHSINWCFSCSVSVSNQGRINKNLHRNSILYYIYIVFPQDDTWFSMIYLLLPRWHGTVVSYLDLCKAFHGVE